MKRTIDLKIKRNVLVALFVVFCTGMTWAQTLTLKNPSNANSEKNPYLIRNAEEWKNFVSDVNGGYSYYDAENNKQQYVQLNNNISVTSMVGVWSETESERKPFRGYFWGNGKTITVTYSNGTAGQYTALFVCTNGATINRLSVAGNITITNEVGNAAGVIGVNYGNTTKINGTNVVSVNITNGSGGSAGDNCAGVVVKGEKVEISSCAYVGQIIAGNNSAGFCVYGSTSNMKIFESLFAPAEGSSITSGGNFVATGGYHSISRLFCYTYQVGSSTQGAVPYSTFAEAEAAATAPGSFCQKFQWGNIGYYFLGSGTVTMNNAPYYQNYAAHGGLSFTVTFVNGKEVTSGNYTYRVKDGNAYINIEDIVGADGDGKTYTLEVTGCNDNAGVLT